MHMCQTEVVDPGELSIDKPMHEMAGVSGMPAQGRAGHVTMSVGQHVLLELLMPD